MEGIRCERGSFGLSSAISRFWSAAITLLWWDSLSKCTFAKFRPSTMCAAVMMWPLWCRNPVPWSPSATTRATPRANSGKKSSGVMF